MCGFVTNSNLFQSNHLIHSWYRNIDYSSFNKSFVLDVVSVCLPFLSIEALCLTQNWTENLRKDNFDWFIFYDFSQLQPSRLTPASVLGLHDESYEEKAIQYWLLPFPNHLRLYFFFFFIKSKKNVSDSFLHNLIWCCEEFSCQQTKIYAGENPSVHLNQADPKASTALSFTVLSYF